MKNTTAKINEMAVLGCILLDNKNIYEATEVLVDEDFFEINTRKLFKLLKKLIINEKYNNVDIVMLNNLLQDDDISHEYLLSLLEATPGPSFASKFIRLVKDNSFRLHLSSFFVRVNHELQQCKAGVESFAEQKGVEFKELVESFKRSRSRDILEPATFVDEAITLYESYKNNRVDNSRVKTGFKQLDEIIRGLKTLNIISATTGMGKTAFALNIAAHIALNQGYPILYLNFEMDKDDLVRRFFSIISEIESDNIQDGIYRHGEWEILEGVGKIIKESGNPFLSDNCSKDINKARSLIYHYKNRHNIKVVFVDYIGEIELDELAKKEKSEYLTYGRYTQAFKEICSDLGIHCILLTQLGRPGEKEPTRSNIQGSWKIVQKADVMLLLYYDVKEEIYKVKVEKLRHGRYPFEVKFNFRKSIHKFEEIIDSSNPPF